MSHYEECCNRHVKMSDANYKRVFNYFRHCYYLTPDLLEQDRRSYVERVNQLFQDSWFDFIWKSNLGSGLLGRMQATKEHMIQEALLATGGIDSRHVSGEVEDRTMSERAIIFLSIVLVIAFILIGIFVKIVLNSKFSTPLQSDQCQSEIDVRRMNIDPPRISPSNSDGRFDFSVDYSASEQDTECPRNRTNMYETSQDDFPVYYETHVLSCSEVRQKECSIPSQVHIKMSRSNEGCNNNPEIIMQKCKTHNKSPAEELPDSKSQIIKR